MLGPPAAEGHIDTIDVSSGLDIANPVLHVGLGAEFNRAWLWDSGFLLAVGGGLEYAKAVSGTQDANTARLGPDGLLHPNAHYLRAGPAARIGWSNHLAAAYVLLDPAYALRLMPRSCADPCPIRTPAHGGSMGYGAGAMFWTSGRALVGAELSLDHMRFGALGSAETRWIRHVGISLRVSFVLDKAAIERVRPLHEAPDGLARHSASLAP